MKSIVPTVALLSTLAACYVEQPQHRLRQGDELQAEYDDKAQASSSCLQDFEDCMNNAGAADVAAILACGDDLSVCLGDAFPGVPGGGAGSGSDTGGGSDGEPEGGSGSGSGSDDGGAGGDSDCDAILDACLADPFAVDPSCFDDFQTCIDDEVQSQLDGICEQLVAECEANAIPGFDCASLCS